jgi:type I restriction enzyme M protein
MASLSAKGSAAVVIPTGFLTAQENISLGIRKKLIDEGMLKGVVSMPSNIFATTGTNVSVIFIDNSVKHNESIFVDASNLGTPVKEGKNQKTVLSVEEEDMIIGSFTQKTNTPDFSQLVNRTEIVCKNYSFNPGQYFDLKLASITINHEEFSQVLTDLNNRLLQLNVESSKLAKQVSADIASSITKSDGTK